jgi:hypothetical protein
LSAGASVRLILENTRSAKPSSLPEAVDRGIFVRERRDVTRLLRIRKQAKYDAADALEAS